MLTVFLLRHFERDLADASQQAPLLPVGLERAAALHEDTAILPEPLEIICSPFRRCFQSVAPLRRAVTADTGLLEHPLTHPWDPALARTQAEPIVRRWDGGREVPAPGETAAQLRERCEDFVRRQIHGRAGGGTVLVCSHQATLRQVAAILGSPHPFDNMGDSLRLNSGAEFSSAKENHVLWPCPI